MNPRRRVVSIIGGAECSEKEVQIAEELGYLLGEQDVIIVCGGRGGVMEAACRGAQRAGGITIGILPNLDPSEGNPYLDVAIPTGMGHARNALIAQAGQCVIAIGGGYGTLSEIGIALKIGRDVVGIGTWEAVDKSGKMIKIMRADNAREAVEFALGDSLSKNQ
ncbi:MAG: TIGR00725 family protein [Chloroflexi bacterium RBG_16_48_8]|nr:MAG: TIGR00725 family protein [Chloroflexi bacterium RBG_16_48_8]